MKSTKLSQAGFTLVELLVAIAVGAVVTLSLTQVVTGYIHLSQRGRYLNMTNAYAEAKIEALRNQGYNAVAIGSSSLTSELPGQLPVGKNGTMNVTQSSAGLKQVDLTITYKDQGQDNTYTYRTYLGELGVGQ
jgi:prepilin-type N-terminal cleavage/methylation domain-containing protein